MKKESYLKRAIPGFLALVIYFVLSMCQTLPLQIFGIDVDSISMGVKVFYLLSYQTLMLSLIMLLFYKTLEENFKDLKKNHKEYFSKYFKYWLIALGIMMFSNMVISLLSSGGIPNNEEIIRENFKISPIYVYISSVFFAPLIEELIFRQGFKNMIPINSIFIVVSGLVFGGLHVVTSMSSVFDLLYLIPYCAPGLAFAYMLAKTDNIFVSIGLHCMHNGLLMSLQFFLLFFGGM